MTVEGKVDREPNSSSREEQPVDVRQVIEDFRLSKREALRQGETSWGHASANIAQLGRDSLELEEPDIKVLERMKGSIQHHIGRLDPEVRQSYVDSLPRTAQRLAREILDKERNDTHRG
jgi:hypothetical protein